MSDTWAASSERPSSSVIARNLGALMASQAAGWALSVPAMVLIPRYLGAEMVGRYHLTQSLWAMGAVLMAFGMNLSVVTHVARNPGQTGPVLGASISARLVLSLPVATLLFGYAIAVGYPAQILLLLAIVGGGVLIQAITDSFRTILRGLDRMAAMSAATVAGQFVFVIGAIALLAMGYGIYHVAIVAGIGNLVSMVIHILAVRRARRELGDQSPIASDPAAIVTVLRESMPYLWVKLAMVFYLQVDTVVISLVVERDEVLGWYSIYDRLGGTLMFVPTVFVTAVYPTLARLYGGDDEAKGDHRRLAEKTFRLMLLISVPLGFGLSTIARPFIEFLFGAEFIGAADVLAIGGVVISLTYLNTVLGTFLISMDRQREWSRFIALGAVLTIPLDFLFIPYFEQRFDNGAIGGAAAYAVTEAVVLCGAIYLLPRGSLGLASVWYAARVIVAGLVMVAAVLPLRELPLVVPIAAGALVFCASVLVVGLLGPDDRRLLIAVLPEGLYQRVSRRQ